MNLGNRIREARLQKQLTQKDVVGDYMTRNMLSKIENGSATPSVKTLSYLAEALDLPVSYLVSENGESPQASAQFEEIGKLAELLEGDAPPSLKAVALCLKARVRMAVPDYEGALALLRSKPADTYGAEGAMLVFKTIEDCCTLMGDYKQAYDTAVRRMELAQGG